MMKNVKLKAVGTLRIQCLEKRYSHNITPSPLCTHWSWCSWEPSKRGNISQFKGIFFHIRLVTRTPWNQDRYPQCNLFKNTWRSAQDRIWLCLQAIFCNGNSCVRVSNTVFLLWLDIYTLEANGESRDSMIRYDALARGQSHNWLFRNHWIYSRISWAYQLPKRQIGACTLC